MSDKKEGQSFQFQLKICSVKMKMKFPCRMALQYNKRPITKEAPSSEQNRFFFNEVVLLKGEGDGHAFEILAGLYTEKGIKYTSGSMKLLSAQLLRSKGERLVIPLTKCLDPQAFCQLIVEGIKQSKDSHLKISRSSSKLLNSSQRPDVASPASKKINSERLLIGETRSEANFQPGFALGSEDRARDVGPKSQAFKTFTKSPNSKYSNIKYVTYNGNTGGIKSQYPVEEGYSHRVSFDEGEVYRQGYLKLKQKFKRQTQLLKQQTRKRVTLQSNENNLRLQIVKIRVKYQQQEKQISQKNEKIKRLSLQLSQFQKKDLDVAYVKEECISLETKNQIQEDNIRALIQDSDSLKKLMAQKSKIDEATVTGLRQQLQLAKNKVDELRYQFQLQVKAKESIIATKNNDIQIRNDTIQRQKSLIKELEEQAELKLFEFERSLTADRHLLQLSIDEQIIKTASLSNEKKGVQQKNQQLRNQIERLNASIAALQFNKKVLNEEVEQLGKEMVQLKGARDKYNELIKDYRFLEQQFATVRKNLQSTLQNKQVDLSDLLKQYQEGKQRSQSVKSEQDLKIRALSAKNKQQETNINILKNTLEKGKRINEILTKQNTNLRQQNKQIREDLKNAERKLISIQTEYSSFSTRNERQSTNLRMLLQKGKQERMAAERAIDNLQEKLERQVDTVKEYEQRDNQWKLKQRHFQQKIQKEINKSKQLFVKYEGVIEDRKNMISEHISSLEAVNNDNRTFRRRINQLQLTAIRDRETSEKVKNELKLSQQKNLAIQQLLKRKQEDEKQFQQKVALLQQKVAGKDFQIGRLMERQVEETTKSKKQDHIVQMLNQEMAKIQKKNEELVDTTRNKEINQDKLRQDLKNEREEVVKEKIKTTKTQNDFEKFKESINDIIRIEFTRILNTPNTTQKNTQRLRESRISNAKSEKIQKSRLIDASSLSTNLLQKLHETKSSLWKMVQLNRILKQENTKLLSHTQNETNKYQFAQLQLHRDIQLLENEMNDLISDKEIECQNYDQLVVELNFRLKDKEAEVEDLREEIAEYEATVNGLKTDFEANNQLNDKKVASLKQASSELNERIEYLNLNVACLEDKNHQLEQKNFEHESEIISYKEMLIKSEKTLLEIKESEEKLTQSQQNHKKNIKIIQQRYEELEMQFNSEKENKQKYKGMLQQEEKKFQKLNDFVNGLITQKQSAIKCQLQKSEQNNKLENQLFEVTHERDLLREENLAVKKRLEESKDENKLLAKTTKGLQRQLVEEKAKSARIGEKVKQRESDLDIKKEYIRDIEQKYRQLRDKNYKQIRQLSNQLEDKSLIAINASKQLNDKIIKVQTQSKRRWEEALSLQQELEALTQLLYSERDKSEDLTLEIARLREEKASIEEEVASRQFALEERADELRRLEDLVSELNLQIHDLQTRCQSQEKQSNHRIEELSNDYHYKQEETAKEMLHNEEILAQEKKQLKSKSDGFEELLQKAMLELKAQTAEYTQKTTNSQERLKKIEAERMSSTLAKNNQIKKITEENKLYHERLREKEAIVRKLSLDVEQTKIQEAQLQARIAQLQEQTKNKQKIHQREIEGLKLKDKLANENKHRILSTLHENEVQIRKLISLAVKKLIESCCKADTEKVLTTMKGLQSSVAQTMMAKIAKQ